MIFPVVTSYYDKEVVYKNFFYQGTGDNSTYYSTAEALKFYQEIGGYVNESICITNNQFIKC